MSAKFRRNFHVRKFFGDLTDIWPWIRCRVDKVRFWKFCPTYSHSRPKYSKSPALYLSYMSKSQRGFERISRKPGSKLVTSLVTYVLHGWLISCKISRGRVWEPKVCSKMAVMEFYVPLYNSSRVQYTSIIFGSPFFGVPYFLHFSSSWSWSIPPTWSTTLVPSINMNVGTDRIPNFVAVFWAWILKLQKFHRLKVRGF